MNRVALKLVKIVIPLLIIVIYGYLIAYFLPTFKNWREDKAQFYLDKANDEQENEKKLLFLQQAILLNPIEENLIKAGIVASKVSKFNIAGIYLSRVKTADGFYRLANNYQQIENYREAERYYLKAIEIDEKSKYWLKLGKTYLKQGQRDKARQALLKADEEKDQSESRYLLVVISLINKNDKEFADYADKLQLEQKNDLYSIFETKSPSAKVNRAYDLLITLSYPQLAYNYLQENKEIVSKDRDGLIRLANEEYRKNNLEQTYQYLLSAKSIDQYYPQTYRHLILVAIELGKNQEAEQYKKALSAITW